MNADRASPAPAKGNDTPKPGSNGDGLTPKETDGPEPWETSELDALKRLLKQFHELREYLSYYATAKTDGAKLFLRNASLWIGLALLGSIAVAGLVVIANWFVLSGAAEGLGVLFGGRLWAGKIIAGLMLLTVLGLFLFCTAARGRAASRERTVRKYEKRQAEQHAEFGRNLDDREAAATPERK